MNDRDYRELSEIGGLWIVCISLAIAVVLAMGGCAHAPPPLWEVCRDACEYRGAVAAAVVGSTKKAEHPACLCAAAPEKPEGT